MVEIAIILKIFEFAKTLLSITGLLSLYSCKVKVKRKKKVFWEYIGFRRSKIGLKVERFFFLPILYLYIIH